MLPENICKLFTEKEYKYDLRRNPRNVNIPFPSNNYKKRSLSYRGATMWNNLSSPAQSSVSLASFKRLLFSDYDLNFT